MIAIAAPVTVAVAVPTVFVADAAAFAFPVAIEPTFAVMMRHHPTCTGVRRAGPVALVPTIAITVGIPIAVDPNVFRARRHRPNRHYTRRGRRANPDSHGDLRGSGTRGQHAQNEQERCEKYTFHNGRRSTCDAAVRFRTLSFHTRTLRRMRDLKSKDLALGRRVH